MNDQKHKFSKIAGILDLLTDPKSEDPNLHGDNYNAATGSFLPPVPQGQAPESIAQMNNLVQAPAPLPSPAPAAPMVQFKAPTMPVNTTTPFKAPQITIPPTTGGASAPATPTVKFTMTNKQAAFEYGFVKRASEIGLIKKAMPVSLGGLSLESIGRLAPLEHLRNLEKAINDTNMLEGGLGAAAGGLLGGTVGGVFAPKGSKLKGITAGGLLGATGGGLAGASDGIGFNPQDMDYGRQILRAAGRN